MLGSSSSSGSNSHHLGSMNTQNPHHLGDWSLDNYASIAQGMYGMRYSQLSKHPLRRGKWTIEEENYTNKIIDAFKTGTLALPENVVGVTLRSYLAEKLECDPMRITKKYTGASCLGKRVYYKERFKAPKEEVARVQIEIQDLEKKFRDKLKELRRKDDHDDGDELHDHLSHHMSIPYASYNRIDNGHPNLQTLTMGKFPLPIAFTSISPSLHTHGSVNAIPATNVSISGHSISGQGAAPSNSMLHMNHLSQDQYSSSHMNGAKEHRIHLGAEAAGKGKSSANSRASGRINNVRINDKSSSVSDPQWQGNHSNIHYDSNDSASSVSSLSSQENEKKSDSDCALDEDKPLDGKVHLHNGIDSSQRASTKNYQSNNNPNAKDPMTDSHRSTSNTTHESHSGNSGSSCSDDRSKYSSQTNSDEKASLPADENEVASSLLGLFNELKQSSSREDLVDFVAEVQSKANQCTGSPIRRSGSFERNRLGSYNHGQHSLPPLPFIASNSMINIPGARLNHFQNFFLGGGGPSYTSNNVFPWSNQQSSNAPAPDHMHRQNNFPRFEFNGKTMADGFVPPPVSVVPVELLTPNISLLPFQNANTISIIPAFQSSSLSDTTHVIDTMGELKSSSDVVPMNAYSSASSAASSSASRKRTSNTSEASYEFINTELDASRDNGPSKFIKMDTSTEI